MSRIHKFIEDVREEPRNEELGDLYSRQVGFIFTQRFEVQSAQQTTCTSKPGAEGVINSSQPD